MTYGSFKDLNKRTAAVKVLQGKAFNITKNRKYDGYKCGLASTVCKFLIKKSSAGTVKNEILFNKELTEELCKSIIRKSETRKVHLSFINNNRGVDLAHMQLIRKFNKRFRFLLCVIDISNKYGCIIPLKDKKGITITNAFQKILNDSKRKPNRIWVEKVSEFSNRSMKSFLQLHNERKSVIAKRFISTLKTKFINS